LVNRSNVSYFSKKVDKIAPKDAFTAFVKKFKAVGTYAFYVVSIRHLPLWKPQSNDTAHIQNKNKTNSGALMVSNGLE
jgi:hypothetical protein